MGIFLDSERRGMIECEAKGVHDDDDEREEGENHAGSEEGGSEAYFVVFFRWKEG